MRKRIFTILIAFLATTGAWAQYESAGYGLSWKVEDKTLIIEGSGAMHDLRNIVAQDFEYWGYSPWRREGQHEINEIIIGEGVTRVGDFSFYSNGSQWYPGYVLSTVSLPSTLESIGGAAFGGCKLKHFFVQSEIPPVISGNSWRDPFFVLEDIVAIYVPEGSVEAYKAAEYWSDYADKIQPMSQVGNTFIENTANIICYDNALSVNTPQSEKIDIYSINGALLFSAQKDAGEVVYNVSNVPDGVLIVRGSSGWVKKVIKK